MRNSEFTSGAESVLSRDMLHRRVSRRGARGLTYGIGAYGYAGIVPLYPPATPPTETALPVPLESTPGQEGALGPQWGGGDVAGVSGDGGSM